MFFLHWALLLYGHHRLLTIETAKLIKLKRTNVGYKKAKKNPLAPFCCVLGKDTLRHFPLLGGLDKKF